MQFAYPFQPNSDKFRTSSIKVHLNTLPGFLCRLGFSHLATPKNLTYLTFLLDAKRKSRIVKTNPLTANSITEQSS